jgi:hypothetical protein
VQRVLYITGRRPVPLRSKGFYLRQKRFFATPLQGTRGVVRVRESFSVSLESGPDERCLPFKNLTCLNKSQLKK